MATPRDTTADTRAGTNTAADGERDPHHARRWLILAVIGVAQLMVVLDATVVNIALPSAQKALHFSDADRQWIVTAYSLSFGSLLLLGGRIADLLGRKPVFLVGLIGFAAASALGGAATDFVTLVSARALQGIFGALLAPVALSLLTTTFTEPTERGKAFGVFGAIAGAGGAVGLLLGGVLTEYTSWRWCLYVNLVFAGVAVAGALLLLHHRRSEDRPKLDIPGTLTASAGLFALVYGFSNAETHGWSATLTLVCFAAGIVLLAVFLVIQRRASHPLLPLRIVLDRNRGGSYLGMFIMGVGMFGVFLFLTYYLQLTLHFSPVQTGLGFLPMVASLMVGAQLSTVVLLPRIGPRPLMTAGMVVAAGGLAWLTTLGLHSSYVSAILPPLLVMGLGVGLLVGAGMSVGTLGVDPHDAGVASATLNTTQQIGGSIGTALLNTLASNAATDYLHGRRPSPDVIAHAQLHSYSVAFWWSAGIFLVGGVLSAVLLRKGAPAELNTGAPAVMH
jgi:EmrB/QacA subfamily drug resistance transporter